MALGGGKSPDDRQALDPIEALSSLKEMFKERCLRVFIPVPKVSVRYRPTLERAYREHVRDVRTAVADMAKAGVSREDFVELLLGFPLQFRWDITEDLLSVWNREAPDRSVGIYDLKGKVLDGFGEKESAVVDVVESFMRWDERTFITACRTLFARSHVRGADQLDVRKERAFAEASGALVAMIKAGLTWDDFVRILVSDSIPIHPSRLGEVKKILSIWNEAHPDKTVTVDELERARGGVDEIVRRTNGAAGEALNGMA